MPTIKEIMRPAVTVEEGATLYDVVNRMITDKRNSLVVVDQHGALCGAVNANDVIKAVLPDYLEEDSIAAHFADQMLLEEDVEKARTMAVRDFMNTDVPTIHIDATVLEAAAQAIKSEQGRIVIVDEEKKPIGIITRTEIKRVIGKLLGLSDSSA